ncbi:hypothetical protein [Hymenobacter elongatus]|uniref:Uncharacterized protein n=1 Tax=Hymenobacter elongatus TaxID=877208 RepID=A0A4Z0PQ49_9BACT|nr:hypothetical protein [Hymenobacter elongatus]TGE19256.1 hypothetical protein E5J99_03180 [Hymenobacter elongatus]
MAAPSSAVDLSLTAAVRAHLGISTRQLARYLGLSMGFVTHVEAGRKGLPPALGPRLLWLARLLPPPLGQGPPALPPPPAPEPLRRRLRDVRLCLLVVGRELARQQALAAALAHRRAGRARLQAAPPRPSPPKPPTTPAGGTS